MFDIINQKMERLSKLNLTLIGLLLFLVGYIIGGLTITPAQNLLLSIWQIIINNEIVSSSILIIIGWFISSTLDRKLTSDQFIADKKFIIAEILLKSLSKYSGAVISSTKLITSLQINYNIPILNSEYNGSTILNDIYKEWLNVNHPYIEFLQNFENYEIVLEDIKPLLDQFKNKVKIINDHFQENYLLSQKKFSNFQSNQVLQQELILLIKQTQEKIWDHLSYIYDVRVGIQNRLLSKIFKNTTSLRVPTVDMEVLT